MNPILTALKKPQKSSVNPSISQLIDGLKSGQIDAKKSALDSLQKLSPQQKVAIRQLVPQIKKLGKFFGANDASIKSFTDELDTYLK